ncbi:hypothetical protein L202_01899 [Cryptococcus amylolentus CBS 6039]|uniref:Zn(2)-C6 fungal-type domain-containing protein n=2 Tax=Cryptococcus amylolentus TaxID=104669 RepID=A0A1E3HYN4_9TREE|nr:hypothetical protein L202_01899 [Cryptococcus amylolentus CBS 6039]ODN81473.1 hypothetical protein L202_01899 [Cryptococcus amylolentus CBS 6039]ODO10293.1 hypothetical protein I350_02522 [Cryptococcus amylolentus CBS 6273]
MNEDQQADNDALASAVAAAEAAEAHQLSLEHPHHFHHTLQQPDFGQHKEGDEHELGVHGLSIPSVDDHHRHHLDQHGELDLQNLGGMGTPGDMGGLDMGDMGEQQHEVYSSGRPPSIRKACDLCHAAKQKCSGDRPSCTRCSAGGWPCNYAPRQRRRTVPKDQKHHHHHHQHNHHAAAHIHHAMDMQQHQPMPQSKKRKLTRDAIPSFGGDGMDMKMAMGLAMDMGMGVEEENEELQTMTDEQMLESIAIDGYLSDLPLASFVHNLPYSTSPDHVFPDDFPSASSDPFPTADMDQHTTSALRDAIFSLNESSAAGTGQEGEGNGEHGESGETGEGEQLDPHLALLDLSNMNGENEAAEGHDPTSGLNLGDFTPQGCNHRQLVPHILSLLTQHTLDPKQGSNTPLTLAVFAPLARSLRLFNSLSICPTCLSSPRETLPQLSLLSRTTTLLTFPHPPIPSSSLGSSAQITIHGARISGTGLSEAIEQHIVGVVWDSWRASVREVFHALDKKAQEVITASAHAAMHPGEGQAVGSLEKQRAGLIFQAVSRLVTAMDEVEGN